MAGSIGANGEINGALGKVSIDSIFFQGSGNAQIYLDAVSHNPDAPLSALLLEGDLDGDGRVSGDDLLARTVSPRLGELLSQSVIVDNKPGGNGAIAAQDVIRSGPDGYALMNSDNGHLVFNPALYKSLTYKVSDLTPVTTVGTVPMMLITGPHSEFKDMRDFIAKAKAKGALIVAATVASDEGIVVADVDPARLRARRFSRDFRSGRACSSGLADG